MIKITTVKELMRVWVEVLISRTNAVTKVSPSSVLSGIAFSNAKLAQKVMTNIATAQSQFLPDSSYGAALDQLAKTYGISPRYAALGSSTYVRISAKSGTIYTTGTHTFSSNNGIVFTLDSSVTVGVSGITYAKVSSVAVGSDTNIDPFTINSVSPIPAGHESVSNEFIATGGRDVEGDDAFRERIKTAINSVSTNTQSRIENIAVKINSKVSRIFHNGTSNTGQIILSVITQNGSDLSGGELTTLTTSMKDYLSLNEVNPFGFSGIGVVFNNATYQPFDISLRVTINNLYDVVEVRKLMQSRMNRYVQQRVYSGLKIEWDDLLQIAKDTDGVDYVFDKFFSPQQDLIVDYNKVARIRGFLLLDETGAILSDGTQNLNPAYYPQTADFLYIANVLSTIY